MGNEAEKPLEIPGTSKKIKNWWIWLILVVGGLYFASQHFGGPASTESYGTLEFRQLRLYQRSDSAITDVEVKNNSSRPLYFWDISLNAYDKGGKFLAVGETNGNNLQPNDKATNEVVFLNVDASRIASLTPHLSKVVLTNDDGSHDFDALTHYAFVDLTGKSSDTTEAASGNTDETEIRHLYSLPQEQALEEAKKFAVGTWTYTKPGVDPALGTGKLWYRMIVEPSGVAKLQMASPTSDNWGDATSGTIQPTTEKYLDTGERFYGFRMETTLPDGTVNQGFFLCQIVKAQAAVLCKDEELQWNILLKRGDVFPFSK